VNSIRTATTFSQWLQHYGTALRKKVLRTPLQRCGTLLSLRHCGCGTLRGVTLRDGMLENSH